MTSANTKNFYSGNISGSPMPHVAAWSSPQTLPPDDSQVIGDVVSMADVKSPDFTPYTGSRSPTAVTATARMIASKVKDTEVAELISEHRHLAYEQIMGRLTRKQADRLKYVRWNLDRIEDARSGEQLDILSAEIALFKQLGDDLLSLKQSVDEINVGKRNR